MVLGIDTPQSNAGASSMQWECAGGCFRLKSMCSYNARDAHYCTFPGFHGTFHGIPRYPVGHITGYHGRPWYTAGFAWDPCVIPVGPPEIPWDTAESQKKGRDHAEILMINPSVLHGNSHGSSHGKSWNFTTNTTLFCSTISMHYWMEPLKDATPSIITGHNTGSTTIS